MELEELKNEAAKLGYRLVKNETKDYDCSCVMPYPNFHYKKGSGRWKCVDKYTPCVHMVNGKPSTKKTYCRKKAVEEITDETEQSNSTEV